MAMASRGSVFRDMTATTRGALPVLPSPIAAAPTRRVACAVTALLDGV